MNTWGEVTSLGSPLGVRRVGDTTDIPVGLVNADLVLAENDIVLLAKAGSGWVVVCKLVAS